jgi:gliding motility-associated protein GldL
MGINTLVQSKGYKNFMSKLYGWGAAVVILGALFKLNHYPFASQMLLIGLMTEAIIFFFSAFEPPHEEVDWSLVYPELAGITPESTQMGVQSRGGFGGGGYGGGLADEILEKAGVKPEVLEKLGTGLKNLSQTVSTFGDAANASIATKEYISNIKNASDGLKTMGESVSTYKDLSEKMKENIAQLSAGSATNKQNIDSLNKNMSALNAVYELQLQGSDQYLKKSTEAHKGLDSMMDNLKNSVKETEKYKEELSKLGSKLEALNSVYGNMLSAMNISK